VSVVLLLNRFFHGRTLMADGFVSGIDVSSNQGPVNWNAVSQSGVVFAFSRATIGGHQTDSQFAANWSGMRNAGIIRGAYHYFWPLTPWQDQVNNFTTAVPSLQPADLSPALDLEEAFLKTDPNHDVWNDIPFDQRLPMIQSWLDKVEQALGMKPIIYTRQNFIANLLGNGVPQIANSLLWIAHYGVSQPSVPDVWNSWAFWQYTDSGKLEGIDGKVDLDYFNGSANDLQAITVGSR